ncbi:hypothetical protein [Paraburkholderia terrae]
MESPDEDDYECYTCDRMFNGRVFQVCREWDRVHFEYDPPEVEISDATALECYCSQACMDARCSLVMANEGVPIRLPGLGPIERCAKCGGPVDMAEYHKTYLATCTDMVNGIGHTVDVDYLAVLCAKCAPHRTTAGRAESEANLAADVPASDATNKVDA